MFAISGTPLRPLNAPSLQVAVERRLGFCQPSPVGVSRRLDFDSRSGCPKPPSKPGEYIKALVSAAATFDDAQMRSFLRLDAISPGLGRSFQEANDDQRRHATWRRASSPFRRLD